MSRRLRLTPAAPGNVDDLVRLVADDHIRRYLLDGQLFDRAWTLGRIHDSDQLRATHGVGLDLAYAADTGDLVGFTGFLDTDDTGAPMLLYALLVPYTGQGLGTELARASIASAAAAHLPAIAADVDAVNTHSVRLLEALGFARVRTAEGAFGPMPIYRLALPCELTTARTVLRPFRATDVDDALAYRNAPELARHLPHLPIPFTRGDAEAFVAQNISDSWTTDPTFAIVHAHHVVGTISLEIELATRSAMLGYTLARPLWRQGIVTEACRAVLAWAQRAHALELVWAATRAENIASQRVLAKLGFAPAGTTAHDELRFELRLR
ncbi:MAG: GNAT family N-acetyltransferase [Kofleriaceae bacterium]|nr:GNAT family N-acetyltransferase [Kofleriaceae bacterium]